MTVLKELHDLVDWLPECAHAEARQTLLQCLKKHDPVRYALFTAPLDDEPETAAERAAVAEAYAAIERGEVISHEDLMRELELESRLD